MKINITVYLDDFYESFDGMALEATIIDYMRDEILKVVKRDPRYKAHINEQAAKLLKHIEN